MPSDETAFDPLRFDTDPARRPAAVALRRVSVGLAIGGVRRVVAPTRVEGAGHLEGISTPCVVVANHHSHADTAVLLTTLPTALRRRMVVAAAADVWFPNRTASWCSSRLIGTIPIDRSKASRRTLELCHRLLDEGWSLLIYPEGHRSPVGELDSFKPGAAWVARRAGVPLVPLYVEGTGRVLPPKAWVPRRHRVLVRAGEPIPTKASDDARELNARIEDAVLALSNGHLTRSVAVSGGAVSGGYAVDHGVGAAGDDPSGVPVADVPVTAPGELTGERLVPGPEHDVGADAPEHP